MKRAIAAAALLVVIAGGVVFFRSAGRLLVHVAPIEKGDAIVILGSARFDRTLEAGQLYREGWAPLVAVLRERDLSRRGVLERLGITLPTYFDLQVSALTQMGVPRNKIFEIREVIESTRGEAIQVDIWARANRFSRIIVVTSTYHTGRAAYYYRAIAPDLRVIMRNPRFDGSDPSHWWQWPNDRIDVLSEYIKMPKAFFSTLTARRPSAS